MFQQSDENSDEALKKLQAETLKSIIHRISKELSLLENLQSLLAEKISGGDKINLINETQKFESDLIRCALIRTMGKQSDAAILLGLKKSTLHDKIKRYKINSSNITA